MLENKIGPKSGAIVVILLALLLFGAGYVKNRWQGDGGVSTNTADVQTPATDQVVAQKPTIETIEPLKLVYELRNYGPTDSSGKLNMTLWIENKTECSGREAYLGVVKMDHIGSNSSSSWAKVAIYADNGEMAISRFDNEDKLAFDDATAEFNQLDIALVMNTIFANAGKNFISSEVWTTTAPVILKDVDSGMSITDYSIIRQEEQSAGVLPCQKFKIVAKGTNMDGTLSACVAKEVNQVKLPFIVSFGFGSQDRNDTGWKLTSYAKEKSGAAVTPQCLEPVKCAYKEEPAQSERSICSAKGGQIEQQRDDKGCVMENKCVTQEEKVIEAISRMQRPGCEINPDVKKKLLACRKNNQPNFDVTSSTDDGCALDIVCRQ